MAMSSRDRPCTTSRATRSVGARPAAGRRAAAPEPPRFAGMVIELPEPCLVVLVGAAGAGKSTLAARLFAPDEVLSSDAHRALVAGDEANQAGARTAFAILHRQLSRRMSERQTTVVDATNVTSFARRSLVRRAVVHG